MCAAHVRFSIDFRLTFDCFFIDFRLILVHSTQVYLNVLHFYDSKRLKQALKVN